MKANTRLFGEIDIEEEKIITLESGMIGFPDMQKFALIFDDEKGEEAKVMWLQSMDDPQVAFPVMRPEIVMPEYNPTVNDEVLEPLGKMDEENLFVVVTVTAVSDVKKNSVNLKAPIIINTETKKGCQIIVEDDYPVKYNIYQALKDKKEKAGE
ncbi:MAG: flagellar assembly protein FliW [Roseburia sp.]